MAMVGANDGSLQADSQPKSVGLVWHYYQQTLTQFIWCITAQCRKTAESSYYSTAN